jgi:hypothetical protein
MLSPRQTPSKPFATTARHSPRYLPRYRRNISQPAAHVDVAEAIAAAKAVAGMEQAVDLRAIPRPLFNLAEVAHVGDEWIGSLLVEVNVHRALDSGMAEHSAIIVAARW